MTPDGPATRSEADQNLKYWAFISYSSRDQQWARWLHRSLESYRVPKRLAKAANSRGEVPERLFPIFRDREELSSSADLGQNITRALRDSRYLIVICSPRAAKSRWVSKEIIEFKAAGGENRVLALRRCNDQTGAVVSFRLRREAWRGCYRCYPTLAKRQPVPQGPRLMKIFIPRRCDGC